MNRHIRYRNPRVASGRSKIKYTIKGQEINSELILSACMHVVKLGKGLELGYVNLRTLNSRDELKRPSKVIFSGRNVLSFHMFPEKDRAVDCNDDENETTEITLDKIDKCNILSGNEPTLVL